MREQDEMRAESLCTDTMEEHAMKIEWALQETGVGGGCEGTYQALVELAEVLRLVHGYEAYQPTEWATTRAARVNRLRQ
jgi:hypothetical protein